MKKAGKRKHKRKTCNSALDYSITSAKQGGIKTITVSETAKTVDISKKGIGIITSYPVMPRRVLKIKGKNGTVLPEKAIVRWRTKKGLWYRAGLKFV